MCGARCAVARARRHPDPEARNLREKWLPAIEWYYSERVRQLTVHGPWTSRAKDASGAELTDEAVRAAADFAIFVDLGARCHTHALARSADLAGLCGLRATRRLPLPR